MKHLLTCLSTALAIPLVFVAASAQVQSPQAALPESGRWITQSGNLEVEIASCGAAFCGTVVRVISNSSMGAPAAPAPAMAVQAAPSPLGKKILFDLNPVDGGGLRGQIYNRGDNKTYNSLVALAGPDELKLTIYQDTPMNSNVQIWRRAGSAE